MISFLSYEIVRELYAMAMIMPMFYVIGMVFSLRTHKHIFVKKIPENADPEESPSKNQNNNYSSLNTITATNPTSNISNNSSHNDIAHGTMSNDSLTSNLLTTEKDHMDSFIC